MFVNLPYEWTTKQETNNKHDIHIVKSFEDQFIGPDSGRNLIGLQ